MSISMAPSPSPSSPIVNLLLGPSGRQRVRASQSLLALVVYLVFAAVQHVEVMWGLIDLAASNALTVFNLCGSTAFYLAIRCGLNERYTADPSLTLSQSAFAMVGIAWSYAITGPARGAVLIIMMLVILFGLFALSARQARALAFWGFGLLAGAMLWKSQTDPTRYDPRVELVHVLFAAIVMISVSVLAIRLGALRSRLSQQKKDLELALGRIQTLATRDELTGLLNRRAMVELLAREHPRIERGQGPLSLGLIDIDWFKRINDTHGHQAGDAVLRRLAERLQAELRAADALARWGGEEFLLLMPGTGRDAAQAVLERLRAGVADDDYGQIAPGLRVSFSAGVVQCGEGESRDHALERADAALYRAKQQGRDRVECG